MDNHLFRPFRALGYITSNVPFQLKSENLIYTIMVSIGNSFQLIHSDKLIPYMTSASQIGKIKTMQFYAREFYVTNSKNNINLWKGPNIENTFTGHSASVTGLLVLDNILLSLSKNNELMMWDLESRVKFTSQLPSIDAKQFRITTMFHPANYFNKVLLGSEQGSLQLWNLKTKKMIYSFAGWGSPVLSIAQSPAINIVAIGLADGRVILHDLKSDATVATLSQKGGVTSISFRSDGTAHMATANAQGKINIWDLEKKRLVVSQRAHVGAIGAAQYFRDEPIMLTNGNDNSLKVWTFHDTTRSAPILLRERSGHPSPPSQIRFFTDDDMITMSAGALRHMNINYSFLNRVLSKKDSKIDQLRAFDCNARQHRAFDTVVSAADGQRIARTWNVENFTIGQHQMDAGANISSIAVSTCGHFAILGSVNGHITKYNMQSGLKRGKVDAKYQHSNAISGLFVDPTNKYIVSGSIDGRITFWLLSNMTIDRNIPLGTEVLAIKHHAESGLYAVVCGDNVVRVFDIAQDVPVRVFDIGQTVVDISFSSDGRWLVIAGEEQLRVYDIPSSALLDWFLVHKKLTSIAFSPRGDYLISTHENQLPVYLWTNQSYFGSTMLEKPSDVPTYLDMPSHQSDQKSISSDDSNDKETGEAEVDKDQGVPVNDIDMEDDNDNNDQDNQEENDDENHVIVDQIGSLITLTQIQKSKWNTLLNLDTIKKRNKPIASQMKPELAPFFLSTITGLEPKFATETETASEQSKKDSNNNSKSTEQDGEDDEEKDPEGWEDWVTPNDETEQDDEDDSTSNDKVLKKNKLNGFSRSFNNDAKTILSKALENSYKSQNYSKVLKLFKKMTPSAIDYEIRSLSTTENAGIDIHMMVDFLCYQLRSNDDFDMIQSLVTMLLRVHGDQLYSENFKEDLEQLKQSQQIGWSRLQKMFHANICMLRYFTNTLQ
ncbi:WD40 repeat-containing protein [Heterostelium album PN500]|uniref:WD40 repeat-containing protein n=1 Tax=Heterostelium pallidum (strain ATCC 26659 / Pp 5 / PN500) TaxID=670386 RepID=D3BIZ7_HETP5|nr:WD40 repeat-containing protein [Heterostelium album PN500]EFA78771.1 WD40 repeat-containing protein [Heterostelium album PN500]|eukprot:XP_020430895.1 WD40 repeat-containing protein [Heterostelium album PN500]